MATLVVETMHEQSITHNINNNNNKDENNQQQQQRGYSDLEPKMLTLKVLQQQNFLREMDLTPVTMVNCLRSTHSDVMHVATTVLAFRQQGPAKGFGANLNAGATSRILYPQEKKKRVKPISSKKKHKALLREHADFMSRLTAERTERLEIESWAASLLQVTVRRFLKQPHRKYGTDPSPSSQFDAHKDRFLSTMSGDPEIDLQTELKDLVKRSNALINPADDDLTRMPPWQRVEVSRQRNLIRKKATRRLQLAVTITVQAITRGYLNRKAVRYCMALEREERQIRAAILIQSHARVFTAKTKEFKLQQQKVTKAVVIQSLFRGYIDRIIVRMIHHRLQIHAHTDMSAKHIQSHARTFLVRKNLTRQHEYEAAVKLQSAARSKLARRRIEEERREAAVIKIQSQTRTRHAVIAAREKRRQNAAIKVQTSVRGILAKKYVQNERETGAAITVQAAARGKLQRNAENRKVQEEAAGTIQAVARGKLARDEHQNKEDGVLAMQKVVRGNIGRRDLQEKKEAATKIQAVQRAKSVRQQNVFEQKRQEKKSMEAETEELQEKTTIADATKVTGEEDGSLDSSVPTVTEHGEKNIEVEAATKVQALARGTSVRSERDAQEKAAVQVQKVVRGAQDRTAVEDLRQERKAALEAEAAEQDAQSRRVKRREIP